MDNEASKQEQEQELVNTALFWSSNKAWTSNGYMAPVDHPALLRTSSPIPCWATRTRNNLEHEHNVGLAETILGGHLSFALLSSKIGTYRRPLATTADTPKAF
ncbi:hypothetical protein PMIN03_007727 [Paraphaeosphaeria minitans]